MKATVFGLLFFHWFILMNGKPIVESNTSTLEDKNDHNIVYVQETEEYLLSLNYKNGQKREHR